MSFMGSAYGWDECGQVAAISLYVTPHEVGSSPRHPVELPPDQFGILGDARSGVFPVATYPSSDIPICSTTFRV
jgi:hypothetical protein